MSVKLVGLNFRAFDLLNVDQIAIEKCVCCASLFSVRERKRESKQEEGEKYLEAEKMKENENTEMWFFFFFFFKFYRNGWVEFGYIVFGLNGSQWVIS